MYKDKSSQFCRLKVQSQVAPLVQPLLRAFWPHPNKADPIMMGAHVRGKGQSHGKTRSKKV